MGVVGLRGITTWECLMAEWRSSPARVGGLAPKRPSCSPPRAPRSSSTTSAARSTALAPPLRRPMRSLRQSATPAAKRWPTTRRWPTTTRPRGIVKAALDNFGDLDIVVNTAGILRDRMVFNMTEAEWDAVLDVHLKGHFNLTKYASIHWRSRAQGSLPTDQLLLGLRHLRRARPAQLRRGQDGHRRLHLQLRQRPRPLRRDRQRDLAPEPQPA